MAKGGPGQEGDGEGGGDKPRTYRMAFLEKAGSSDNHKIKRSCY